ncbi:hypothetical protein [Nakamurella endophytica]|uniref:hypothetical protein n=1 Tax=Nakamurella endophytica TaxID=1748367 RepID=UPI00166B19D3|nr:hypothetical protein [Nakamurella endophytica]
MALVDRSQPVVAGPSSSGVVGSAAAVSPAPAGPVADGTCAASVRASARDGWPPVDARDPHCREVERWLDAVLDRVRVPDGSVPLPRSPLRALDHRTSTTGGPAVLDRSRWWRVPLLAATAQAWVHAHLPAGARVGWTDLTRSPAAFQAWLPGGGCPCQWPEVQVVVVPAGGGSAVRVDADALWVPSRTVAETVGDDVVSVDVVRSERGAVLRRSLSASAARPVARALDALPVGAPTVVAGGPSEGDTGATARLVFHRAAGPAVDVRLVVDGPAAGAYVTVAGRAQPWLGTYGTADPRPRDVDRTLRAALGLPAR